jgi:hypothetical protein
MAAKKNSEWFMIVDGPGLLEVQFSDYNPRGHVIDFTVEETDGAMVPGEIFEIIGARRTLRCQITGTDRVERSLKDRLGREIPATARLIRARFGWVPVEGWYDARKRKGFLRIVPDNERF